MFTADLSDAILNTVLSMFINSKKYSWQQCSWGVDVVDIGTFLDQQYRGLASVAVQTYNIPYKSGSYRSKHLDLSISDKYKTFFDVHSCSTEITFVNLQ